MKTKIIKTLNNMTEDMNKFGMKYGTHPDSIDKELYTEDKEIIHLNYDRASKMMAVGSATFIGSTALMVAFIGRSLLGFRIFLLMALLSLPWTWYWNVRMNKCFHTTVKKIKSQKK